jgi:hypothetical protein
MGGTDAAAAANHRLDLTLEAGRAQRALLLHVRANLGQAIIVQRLLEQVSAARMVSGTI